jgi:hypothetical protein
MIIWLKRIGFIAVIVIMLEIVAWVGIALFGDDWLKILTDSYTPENPTEVVETHKNEFVERCSTFDGEIFCIKEKK